MAFVYLFFASLVGLITLFVIARKNHTGASSRNLQNGDYWFSIDVAKVSHWVRTNFHQLSRPLVRSVLHKLLEVYLRSINYIRRVLRKHIKGLLHYYAEEHDRLYHVEPSKFLAEMQIHKEQSEKHKKANLKSLDEYSQDN